MLEEFIDREHLTVSDDWYRGYLKRFCELWFYGDGEDVTSKMVSGDCRGEIVFKEKGIIAGIEEVEWICHEYGTSFDGKIVSGDVRDVLRLERLILNVLGKMSGIATNAVRLKGMAPGVLLCPTRKTDWGPLDKKACLVGGCGTHRLGLWDAILIKDNHLAAGVDLLELPSEVKFVEIEVKDLSQLRKIEAEVPVIVMLDNFGVSELKDAISRVRDMGYLVEVSGGITEKNLQEYAKFGPDIISMSCLTRGVGALDVGFDLC